MGRDITVDELEEVIKQIFDDLNKSSESALSSSTERMAKEAVKLLKKTSPKRSGNYSKSWKYKGKGSRYSVYNEKHYRLTHLLENGHKMVVNGVATGKNVRAIPHIKPTEDKISDLAEDYFKEEFDRRL